MREWIRMCAGGRSRAIMRRRGWSSGRGKTHARGLGFRLSADFPLLVQALHLAQNPLKDAITHNLRESARQSLGDGRNSRRRPCNEPLDDGLKTPAYSIGLGHLVPMAP